MFSVHFHSVKGRFRCGMSEVADFHAPVFTAVDAIVVYFQSTVIFPSWTSRVRVPSPAPSFQQLACLAKSAFVSFVSIGGQLIGFECLEIRPKRRRRLPFASERRINVLRQVNA